MLADFGTCHQLAKLDGIGYRRPIDGHDDVAWQETGSLGRRACRDVSDHDSGGWHQTGGVSDGGRETHPLDPEEVIGGSVRPTGAKLGKQTLGLIHRDGETDTLSGDIYGGVDPDNAAPGLEKRSP